MLIVFRGKGVVLSELRYRDGVVGDCGSGVEIWKCCWMLGTVLALCVVLVPCFSKTGDANILVDYMHRLNGYVTDVGLISRGHGSRHQ